MKCEKCGAEMREGAKFCENCGSEVINKSDNPLPVQENSEPNPQINPQPELNQNPQMNQQPGMHQNPQMSQQPGIQQNPHMNSQPVNQMIGNQPSPAPAKPRKSWYKRWWIWLLMGIGTIIILLNMTCTCAICSSGSSYSTESTEPSTLDATKEVKPTEEFTEKPTERPTEKPTEDPKKTEADFKASCSEIDFKTLSRNPEKYKGNNYVFTGEVIQVMDSDSWFSNTTTLRVNITKEEFEYIDDVLWSDPIIATVEIPDGADRIIENDVIRFWGTCDGLYTYERVMGQNISVPKVDIKYYQVKE